MDLREDTFNAALQVSKAFYDCWSKYDRGSPGDPTEARKVITRAQAVLHKKGYVASTKVQQYSNQALEAATKAAPMDGENHTLEVKQEQVVHAASTPGAKPRQKGKGGKDKGAANKRVPGGGSAACKGEVSVKKKGRKGKHNEKEVAADAETEQEEGEEEVCSTRRNPHAGGKQKRRRIVTM